MVSGRERAVTGQRGSIAIRLWLVLAFAVPVGAAVGIRLLSGGLENTGLLQQATGTALYASGMYAVVLFVAPRLRAAVAAVTAIAACWAIEFAQLTTIPATLSDRSVLLRLVFGRSFDWVDVAWYPAGVVPLALVDGLLGWRRASAPPALARGADGGSRAQTSTGRS